MERQKKENGKGGFQEGGFSKGGFSKGGFKRGPGSDDPNLIWGRNFDDEPISLDQVVAEMGEITVPRKDHQLGYQRDPK